MAIKDPCGEQSAPPQANLRPRKRPSRPAKPQARPTDFSVVGIGASAGGLDACQKLLDTLPVPTGMAFILVQHLDPTHESMMVELLAGHTALTVLQAADGMKVEPDHLYIIPPGVYLSVTDGALCLSPPLARHGARLPYDFLLHSLAKSYGARAIGVVLSGTGADGSDGVMAIRGQEGLVVAQDPTEAKFDGMPRSAIATGAVDMVLPVAEISSALVNYARGLTPSGASRETPDWLPQIIELLRARTAHDFRLYKPGTLQRRIERRLAMTSFGADGMDRYIELLSNDPDELELLAKDLLINVTNFFRDPAVFDHLAENIIPDLVRGRDPSQPIRVWVAGCSSGEETYSLAILFREAVNAAGHHVKLCFFASDVDPDAIAHARAGLYPKAIEADVSPDRLARFFTKEEHGYRVASELRDMVVFAVQDVLTDPPFSRLDMVSCRNLLIYLQPEAQAKVISLFHFALLNDGILLLGTTERVGKADDRFMLVSKPCQLYRHVGHRDTVDLGISAGDATIHRLGGLAQLGKKGAHGGALSDLCRQLVLDTYAPAAVLVNARQECLYSLGPIERYLRPAPGYPTHDLYAMADPDLRVKLRAVVQQATQDNSRATIAGGTVGGGKSGSPFDISAQPVMDGGEPLILICFIDQPAPAKVPSIKGAAGKALRVAELERELKATRTELQGAIRNLEAANDRQKAINEEALSVSEEFQTTNEELLTSKEELQSLNEELTALNSQLQETLERQRTTSNDLQNVLYSTNVATLFLDTKLNIRFFTPATRSLFKIIPGDVGRPLADLRALAADDTMLSDAQAVLLNPHPLETEIEAQDGTWYARRILPYRTKDNRVEGVVITFANITETKQAAEELAAAKRRADQANIAKSRFLAAASHDLRQPLQTFALLQGILSKIVDGDKAQRLLGRLNEALGAMSGMLNALLDINQIEAGTIRVEKVDFSIDELLGQLKDEFAYHTEAQGIGFRFVPCHVMVNSDPRLLEQMIRNLLSNALKYTKSGRVLLGCRRRGSTLSIEVWDTGIGIPSDDLNTIFEEYHQLDNAEHDRSRGLGLGLSIVQRLGALLDHPMHVRSELGKGSGFSLEVAVSQDEAKSDVKAKRPDGTPETAAVIHTGTILIIEDDPEVRDLLDLLLTDEGHQTIAVGDGVAALEIPAWDQQKPDLILADYNLPGGMSGIEVVAKLREAWHEPIPVLILTGDISTATLREISTHDCLPLHKPVKARALSEAIQRLLPQPPVPTAHAAQAVTLDTSPVTSTIYVIDDDRHVRDAIWEVVEEEGYKVEGFGDAEDFLAAHGAETEGCLLIDNWLPGISGLELLQRLRTDGNQIPAIMITGRGDISMAVRAMKAGASDFIEKPFSRADLLASVKRATELTKDEASMIAWRQKAATQIAGLTLRQRQIMDLVLAGHPNKNIAADLGISQRTVENHRAAVMKKTGVKSLPALARLAVTAASH
ncbi:MULTISPECIES: chemotaxis protein CheB [Kordiimonas]|jgi:two-component system CheB/CheR fusion protein|uniref:chemotaxis protein CheB n=1 Tax=Kordiimonas TaxID=288021 RepID=UPI00257B572F|nr:chemotaxis protein CheB [Kordiimonas sp. UBA4487]